MRCPNCNAIARPDGLVCDVCGATLSTPAARGAPPQPARSSGTSSRRAQPSPPTPVRRPDAVPPTPTPSRQGGRPGTLGDLFGKSSPSAPPPRRDRGAAPDAKGPRRVFPSFGPRRAPQPPPAVPDRFEPTPSEPEEPRPRKPYRRNTAGVVSDLRAALEEMPFLPGKRGVRDRILHPRPSEGPAAAPGPRAPRGPAWLMGWREEQQARLAARNGPPEDSWAESPVEYGRPGPIAAPEPMYQDDWQAPPPQAEAGWGFAPSPVAPPGLPGPDPWGDPATYGAPPAFDGQAAPGLDSRYDTGHGWSIVTSSVQEDPSRSFIRLGAVHPSRANIMYRVLTELTHLTFNMILLGIILTILAIPTVIGIARVTGVVIPVPWHVSAPTPRPIPTPYPGYKTYRTAAFTIAYPSDWKAASSNDPLQIGGTVQEEDFSGPSNVSLAVGIHVAYPQDQLTGLLEGAPAAFSQGRTANFQVALTPRAGPTIDGHQWLWEEFTFDLTDGQRTTAMEGATLVVNEGLYTYVIVYQAPAAQFGPMSSQYFNQMLGSFRFGS